MSHEILLDLCNTLNDGNVEKSNGYGKESNYHSMIFSYYIRPSFILSFYKQSNAHCCKNISACDIFYSAALTRRNKHFTWKWLCIISSTLGIHIYKIRLA